MKYGISVPTFGDYSDARAVAELAAEAEASGWDGFFVWDHILGERIWKAATGDPWVTLTAIAMRTERIRLGTMVTPVARRRPWKLARETVTLDRLSGGRLILGVGLGYPGDAEFAAFGEDAGERVRAQKLDEGLDVLTGLWSGKPFAYDGEHYQLDEVTFLPAPLQQPRIPIWCAAMLPSRAPLRRAARWDGVFPTKIAESGPPEPLTPDDVRATLAYVGEHRRATSAFDLAVSGETGDDRARDAGLLTAYGDAGATWWIEEINGYRGAFDEMRERVRRGPPG